jgi:hypothetical protein
MNILRSATPDEPEDNENIRKSRNTDPETSHEAEATVDKENHEAKLLEAFKYYAGIPRNSEEAAKRAGLPQGANHWTRCSTLERKGLIELAYNDEGKLIKRKSPTTGRSKITFRIKDWEKYR